jgi:hypothetical protein
VRAIFLASSLATTDDFVPMVGIIVDELDFAFITVHASSIVSCSGGIIVDLEITRVGEKSKIYGAEGKLIMFVVDRGGSCGT